MQGSNIMKHSQPTLRIAIILALVLVSMPAQSAAAASVRYAKPTASGTGNCSSWANACTLQSALSGAVSGNEIWVKKGTHKPTSGTDRTISFQLVSEVAVYGGFAGTESALAQRDPTANPTILSGDLNGDDGANFANNDENSYFVLNGGGTDATAILDGFTVKGGNANGEFPYNCGGGMFNDSGSPTIRRVIFSGNQAIYGGGICNDSSSPSLTKVTISDNQAYYGSGMYNGDGDPSLTNVTISGNPANTSGGGMFNYNSSPDLTNVTFSGNSATTGGGMYNGTSSSPSLTNVIIANSASGGDCVNVSGSLDAASANNLIEDDANACGLTNGVNGNIIGVNPKLSPLGNFGGWTETQALQPDSPAIDMGTNSNCPETDQRGVSRPQRSQCDIGAYEYDYTGIYYVKPAASGAGICSSWANACTLQSALKGVVPGDEIWAMAGTHKPTSGTDRTISFQLKNGVEFYGGFAGTESDRAERNPAANPTILSGDLNGDDGADFANNDENSYHVVNGSDTDSSAVLDGFTVSGGNANGSYPDNGGGGIYNESGGPTIRNVTFSGNWAGYGGGMYNENGSSPSLSNVTFSSNSANFGGGMENWTGNPSLTNVTFNGNSAILGGGLLITDSDPSLANVTFSGNQADNGGGIYNENTSNTSLTNVIVADSVSGGDCVNEGAILDAASANNLIEDETHACGLTNGTNGNIIGSDPNLAPLANYGGWTETQALLPGSPAIDAGSDSDCPSTDQRGVTRPFGAHCDTGAYELNSGRKTFRSQAKYDGWVLESGEFTKMGGTKNNLGKALLVGDNAQDKQYRVILSFGTAVLPDRAVITKVILKVKWAGVVGKNPMFTHNGLVVDIKKNKFFTLPALQINDFQAKANKLKAGKFSRKLYSGWYRSILYTGAYPYINVKGRTQLRLRFLLDDNNDNVADILKLYSGNAILANRPQLIVEYYVP